MPLPRLKSFVLGGEGHGEIVAISKSLPVAKELKESPDARYRRNNPEKASENSLRHYLKRYGITISQYNDMLFDQFGVCKICGNTNGPRRLAVDHCHETGKVRALLCGKCNSALGSMNESPELLRKAAAYLEDSKNG